MPTPINGEASSARRPAAVRLHRLAAARRRALDSYQAGVYEALAEAELHPDWVAGISIGAINAG